MKKYYIKTDSEDIIKDCLTYPFEDYTEIKINNTLPDGVCGGWFKLIDGKIVELVEKNPDTINNRIKQAIDEYTLTLIEGGIL